MPEIQPTPPSARDIFVRALEMAVGGERNTFLDEACHNDPELRREVEALLGETDQLGDFLEASPVGVLRSSSSSTASGDDRSEHIGPYKLLQELGEGGCGVVYMAEQEHPVRRRVALKIIKLGMDTKSVIARFESERQALAMMDHPNIAKVLDAGATDNGRPYFVMELVRGVRLTEYCDQHKLTTEDRLKLFIQVVQAIQHAHQKGIIHRDIKPSNILVTLHDGVPVPKIIDFGIAKAVYQRLTDKTLFTEFQSFIGTPAYMSPEQAEMSGLDIDTRSDIYSLGVLLYELLVGSTPFDAHTLRDAGLDECRRTIREDEPARPSQRLSTLVGRDSDTIAALRQSEGVTLVSRLRGELDWIVMKCLEKDRQRRYATANALAMDVERYLNGHMVSARSPSTLYRLQKSWRRNRVALTAAALILTTLMLGIGVSSWLALRATKAEKASTRLRHEAEANLTKAVQSAERARLNEYVADMNVANHSLREGNFGRAWQLLEKHRPEGEEKDLRGFEWRYLAALSQGDEHLAYPDQGATIHALSFSPDGILLAVGMEETVKVWDVRTQSLVVEIPKGARDLVFVSGGQALATADSESVRIWNTTTWSEQLRLPGRASELETNGEGTLLGTSTRRSFSRRREKSEIKIWDAASWEQLVSLERSGTLSFLLGNQFLIGSSRGIELWELGMREPVRVFEDSEGILSRTRWLAVAPDGATVIAPRNDRSLPGPPLMRLWDVESGSDLGYLPEDPEAVHHQSTISAASWAPDGQTFITGGRDHSIQVWNPISKSHVRSLRGHRNEVWAMAVNAAGETVATGGKDGQLMLWPLTTTKKPDKLVGAWEPLNFNADGNLLVAVNRQSNHLALVQTTSLSHSKILDLNDEETDKHRAPPVALSGDWSTVAVVLDNHIRIMDLEGNQHQQIPLNGKRVSRFSLSSNGRYMTVSHRRDSSMDWWDLDQPKAPLLTIEAEIAVFSSDGSTLATRPHQGSGAIEIWDVATRERRCRMEPIRDTLFGFGLALSHDGKRLAVATGPEDANHAILLWDTDSGDLLGSCQGHKQGIWTIAFSPDGATLASSSDDRTLKLWNTTTQQELISIPHANGTVASLVFSPDGQWLAAASGAWPFARTGEMRLVRAPRR